MATDHARRRWCARGYALAHEPVVASVLTGTAKAANLTRNLDLFDIKVPQTEFAKYAPYTVVQELG